MRNRIQGRRRLYQALRTVGVAPHRLYDRLSLNPVRVTAIPAAAVEERLGVLGARVLESEEGGLPEGIESRVYFATK
jgi:hypothetical protein